MDGQTYSGEDLSWLRGAHGMRRGRRTLDECGMVRVNVCSLDVDQTLGVVRRRSETFSEELRHDLDQLRM